MLKGKSNLIFYYHEEVPCSNENLYCKNEELPQLLLGLQLDGGDGEVNVQLELGVRTDLNKVAKFSSLKSLTRHPIAEVHLSNDPSS